MRHSILVTLLASSSLVAAQNDPSPRDAGAPGEATVFATNGSGINRDELFAEPVVLGKDWTLTLKPQDDRGPGVWFVLLRSAESAGQVLDLGTKFGLQVAGPSELLVDPRAMLADVDAGAHGGGGSTASLTVPVPLDRALMGHEWYAQAIVLGDLPASSGELRTLGFDGAVELPWSEQGFTFGGFNMFTEVAGALRQWTSGFFYNWNLVELRREDGGRFDLLSVDVENLWLPGGPGGSWANLETPDCSSYLELDHTGTIVTAGPEWQDLQSLWIVVNGTGDAGMGTTLTTDDFVVRVPGPPAGAGVLDPWFSSAVGGVAGNFGSNAVTAPLYADGSVLCTGADDLSQPVGSAALRPVGDGISFQVVLEGAAPNWDYYVELSRNGTCEAAQQFRGLTTDSEGKGVFEGLYVVDPGWHTILVDVVSDPPGNLPSDPRLRELAPGALMTIVVGSF